MTLLVHATMGMSPSLIAALLVAIGPPVQGLTDNQKAPPPAFQSFYDGCSTKAKNCIGIGKSDCLTKKTCDVIVTFKTGTQGDVIFQAAGRPLNAAQRYIAVGISNNNKMGNDTVLSCIQHEKSIEVVISFNTPDRLNTIILPTEDADQLRDSFYELQPEPNSQSLTRLVCNFTIPLRMVVNNVEFDMSLEKYHILVAEGKSKSPKNIGYHWVQGSFFTKNALNVTLKNFQKVLHINKRNIEQALSFHAFIMPFSFLCLLPTSMLVARFMKESHLNKRIFQKRIWVSLHTGSQLLSLLLALAGVITLTNAITFLPREESHPSDHYKLGLTCLAVYLVNVGTGMFHGFVEGYFATKLVTGIIHWGLGAGTYALAATQIFLVPFLVPSHLENCTAPSLIVLAWAFLFVIVYIILTVVKFIGDTSTTKTLEKISSSTAPMSTTTVDETPQEPEPEDTTNANLHTKSGEKPDDKKTKKVVLKTNSKQDLSAGSKSKGGKKNKVEPASGKNNPPSLVDKLLNEEYLEKQENPIQLVPMKVRNKEFDVHIEHFPDYEETALFHDFQLDPATDADDDLWTVSRSRRRRNRFRVFYQFPLKMFSIRENPMTKSFDVIIGGFFVISFIFTIVFFIMAAPAMLGGKCSTDRGQSSQWFLLDKQ